MTKINLLSFLFFFTVLQNTAQNKDIKINLKVFDINNTSIRAIEVVNDSTLWFAGANGKYGKITNSKVIIDSLSFNDKALNFRSIAYNGTEIFILSIESPALLYKINPKKLGKVSPEIVYQENHEKVFYDSMTFFDNKHGIAMGDPTDNCLSIILTKDGGNTWNKIKCENLPESPEGEAAFAASDTNIAINGKKVWIATGGTKARIFISNNYGENWEVYNTPIVQGSTMTGIFTVDFFDNNNGIVMGGNWEEKSNTTASKALTVDGGKTWSLIDQNMVPGYISCVKYIPETQGNGILAVSTEGIYHSRDKGVSWNKISDKGFFSIRFIDKHTAWLSGHEKLAKLTFE